MNEIMDITPMLRDIKELKERVSFLEQALAGKLSAKKFVKPTPEEVDEYSKKIGAFVNGQGFCDFYESKGWLVGKSPMKDWQATVRTWKKGNLEKRFSGTTEHVGFWSDKGPQRQPDGFQPLFPGHRPDK